MGASEKNSPDNLPRDKTILIMKYQKLVRELIPQLIEEDGNEAITRTLEPQEHFQALKDKLLEEVEEYIESEDTEELADIVEIVRSLLEHHMMTYEDLEQTRKQRIEEHGSYSARIFLEEVIEN